MVVQNRSRGFTLLELMVVLTLIGIVFSMLAPRLTRRSPAEHWPNVLDELNNCIAFARQIAVMDQCDCALAFNRGQGELPDFVVVEQFVKDPEDPLKEHPEPLQRDYFKARYEFSPKIRINAVYLRKEELLAKDNGVGRCRVVPDGLVQGVVVHMTRIDEHGEDKASFAMDPFQGMFSLHDGHVKPGAT